MTLEQLLIAYGKIQGSMGDPTTAGFLINAIKWLQSYDCYVNVIRLDAVPEWRDESKKTEFILKYM